jgi:hypothetical protein
MHRRKPRSHSIATKAQALERAAIAEAAKIIAAESGVPKLLCFSAWLLRGTRPLGQSHRKVGRSL